MKLKICVLAVSTVLLSQAAFAAATSLPVLSGTYLLTYTETCQTTFSWGTDPSTGDINTINSVDNGKITSATATATFDASSHKLYIVGGNTTGDLLIIQEHGGQAMTTSPYNNLVGYFVTAHDVGFAGAKYHAAFSPASGQVTSFVFSGLTPGGNNCAVTGTGVQATPAP